MQTENTKKTNKNITFRKQHHTHKQDYPLPKKQIKTRSSTKNSDLTERYNDLEQKLIYKAKRNRSTVIKVNPRYTSQCCPVCGHIEKSNGDKRLHLFTCKNCSYKPNDDRIGAMNLHRVGINYLVDSQV